MHPDKNRPVIAIILASFLFLLLLTIITVYGYRAYVRPSRIYDRVGGVADSGRGPSANARDLVVRVFEQIGERIPLSPSEQTVTRRDLTMAGSKRAIGDLLEFQSKTAWIKIDGFVVSVPARAL